MTEEAAIRINLGLGFFISKEKKFLYEERKHLKKSL